MTSILPTSSALPSAANVKAAVPVAPAQNAAEEESGVVYEKGASQQNAAEAKKVSAYDRTSVAKALKSAQQARDQQLADLVRSLITKQGKTSNLKLFGLNLTVTPEASAQAQAALEEGGEQSVSAVADRILQMAEALSGGDAAKLSTLRNAVQKGFDEAAGVWGGELPQICQDTYREVMDRFDAWEKTGALPSAQNEGDKE